MAVYVDDARIPARVGRIDARWSHLTADTTGELHAFARQIGLRRTWYQQKPHGAWHYDVTDPKRIEAVQLGAVEVPWREFGQIWKRPGREGRPVEVIPGVTPGTGTCLECAGTGTAEEAERHGIATGHAVLYRPK